MTDPSEFDALACQVDVAVGDLLDVLSDPVAFHAVAYLAEAETASVEELADVVTGWTNADSGAVATPADRDQVQIELYHVSLPKLAKVGVVSFDSDAMTVSLVQPSDTVTALLAWVRTTDIGHLEDGN